MRDKKTRKAFANEAGDVMAIKRVVGVVCRPLTKVPAGKIGHSLAHALADVSDDGAAQEKENNKIWKAAASRGKKGARKAD